MSWQSRNRRNFLFRDNSRPDSNHSSNIDSSPVSAPGLAACSGIKYCDEFQSEMFEAAGVADTAYVPTPENQFKYRCPRLKNASSRSQIILQGLCNFPQTRRHLRACATPRQPRHPSLTPLLTPPSSPE